MPRKKLIRSTLLPYHITARTNNREPFFCSAERSWEGITFALFESTVLYNARPHAFVLMPNHFHLLMSTPSEDLGQVMKLVMESATKTINRQSGRTGRVFGAKYFQTLINSSVYFAHAYKYIYRNPIKAGLCARVEEYPFSTLSGLLGKTALPLSLHYPYDGLAFQSIPNPIHDQLDWLNRPFRREHEDLIRKSLQKTVYAPPKAGWKRTLEAAFNEPML